MEEEEKGTGRRRGYTAAWVLIGAVFLLVEGMGLGDPASGDTLSEHIWPLLEIEWFRWLAGGFWLWLTFHFFAEPRVRRALRERKENDEDA